MLAHEVFHSFKNKTGRQGWIPVKVDLEKAYDRYNGILFCYARKIGGLIKKNGSMDKTLYLFCFIFSSCVNGIRVIARFFPTRGIRLGDPCLRICLFCVLNCWLIKFMVKLLVERNFRG